MSKRDKQADKTQRNMRGVFMQQPEVMLQSAFACGFTLAGQLAYDGHGRALRTICKDERLTSRAANMFLRLLLLSMQRRTPATNAEGEELMAAILALATES